MFEVRSILSKGWRLEAGGAWLRSVIVWTMLRLAFTASAIVAAPRFVSDFRPSNVLLGIFSGDLEACFEESAFWFWLLEASEGEGGTTLRVGPGGEGDTSLSETY